MLPGIVGKNSGVFLFIPINVFHLILEKANHRRLAAPVRPRERNSLPALFVLDKPRNGFCYAFMSTFERIRISGSIRKEPCITILVRL